MTAYRHVTIFCDGGCNADVQDFDTTRIAEARRELKRLGWMSKDGEDFCPKCKDTNL